MMMKTKNKTKISVLLIEDLKFDAEATLPLVVDSGYAQGEILVVGNLDDASQFLLENRNNLPELIILDLGVPKDNKPLSRTVENDEMIRGGLSFLRRLNRDYGNKLSVIVHSRFPTAVVLYQVVSQGVSFIAKHDYDKEFFSQTVKNSKNGHVIISSSAVPLLKQIFLLSMRVNIDEEDGKILEYLFEGLTDREIATKMSWGEEWVANRLRRMFKKFGFNKREDLAQWYRDYVRPLY